jgi:hypothetical protein
VVDDEWWRRESGSRFRYGTAETHTNRGGRRMDLGLVWIGVGLVWTSRGWTGMDLDWCGPAR